MDVNIVQVLYLLCWISANQNAHIIIQSYHNINSAIQSQQIPHIAHKYVDLEGNE
jgi:hypothetical protein